MKFQNYLKFENLNYDNLPFILKQYYDFKAKYKHFILLFQIGDFYETYFEDAINFSDVTGSLLTRKKFKETGDILMSGIPSKSVNVYIEKLLNRNYNVAVVSQTQEKDDNGKTVRKITNIYTKGCLIELGFLNPNENNYLVSIYKNENYYELAYTDVSVGEIFVTKGNLYEIEAELARLNPVEIIVPNNFESNDTILPYKFEHLDEKFYKDKNNMALSALNSYIEFILGYYSPDFEKIKEYSLDKLLLIDFHTRSNLELLKNSYNNEYKGSVCYAVDNCFTPMGKRLLKSMVSSPVCDINKIKNRLKIITNIKNNPSIMNVLDAKLQNIGDILRLSCRVSNGTITPLEFLTVRMGLKNIVELENINKKLSIKNINEDEILQDFYDILDRTIQDDIELVKEGKYIKEGVNSDLDIFICEYNKEKEKIKEYETKLRETTGIKALKIVKKAGSYTIEVPNTSVNYTGPDFKIIQKNKLITKYTTDTLISLDKRINSTKNKIEEIKANILENLRAYSKEIAPKIREFSKTVAYLDVMLSIAKSAIENDMISPDFKENLNIVNGRHIGAQKIFLNYEPLSIKFDTQGIMLTGANGIGKSMLLKEIGTLVVLAQAGFYVSADKFELKPFKKLFSSLNAKDEIISKKSAHQNQMAQVKRIIDNSDSNSLILLDEIGKNTNYKEGAALFYGIIKYIIEKRESLFIFTTHFPALKNLFANENKLSFYEIVKHEDKRKVIQGVSSLSRGIESAKNEDLPDSIIEFAKCAYNSIN